MHWQPHHTVWAVLGIGSIANLMFRRGLGPVLIPLRDAFGLSYSEASLVAFVPGVCYALVQLPAGHLGDRFGRGRVLFAGSLLWGTMLSLSGAAPSFAGLLVLLALAGVGQGALIGNDRPLVAIHTPPERQGMGQALTMAAGGMGMLLGTLGAGLAAEALGWRYAFPLFAAPVFLFAWAVRRWIYPLPERAASGAPPGSVPSRARWQALATPRLAALYAAGAAVSFTTWFLSTWGPALLMDAGVPDLRAASAFASLLGLAFVVGLPITGAISDRLARDQDRALLLAALLAGTSGLVVTLGLGVGSAAHPIALLGLAIAVLAVSSGCFSPLMVLLSAEAPPRHLGLTYGLANTLWQGGAVAAPVIGGWLRDATASFASTCYLAAALLGASAAAAFVAYSRAIAKEGGR